MTKQGGLHEELLSTAVATLPERLRDVLLERGARVERAAGALLIDDDCGRGDFIFVFSGGTCEYVAGNEGRELVIGLHSPPAAFVIDEPAPVSNPRATRLRALNRVRFVRLCHDDVASVSKQYAPVREFLQDLDHLRTRRILRTQRRLAFEPATVRCADMLIELARKFGVRTERGLRLTVPITYAQLASFLCLTPRHLRRFVPQWEKDGILARDGDSLELRNVAALESLSQPVNSRKSSVDPEEPGRKVPVRED